VKLMDKNCPLFKTECKKLISIYRDVLTLAESAYLFLHALPLVCLSVRTFGSSPSRWIFVTFGPAEFGSILSTESKFG
jgi:hypothetical protein